MTGRNFDLNRTVEISPANHLYTSCLGLRSIVYPCITTSYRLMPSSVNPLVLTEIINVQKHMGDSLVKKNEKNKGQLL